MIIPDVNVLVYAHREEAEEHVAYARWLQRQSRSDEAFGVSELVLSGFVRVVTHPRIFKTPSPLGVALDFVSAVRSLPNAVIVVPTERHWGTFIRLCQAVGARGNLVPDAYLAALAVDSGSEWITVDRDFSRFPGLRWRHPLAS